MTDFTAQAVWRANNSIEEVDLHQAYVGLTYSPNMVAFNNTGAAYKQKMFEAQLGLFLTAIHYNFHLPPPTFVYTQPFSNGTEDDIIEFYVKYPIC